MPRFAFVALLLLALLPAAKADGWRFANGIAGYAADDGDFNGLWLACSGSGTARLFVSTGGVRLERGFDQTVVVTIDSTSFIRPMRADADARQPVLGSALAATEARRIAALLAKGKAAEVSTPAGRFALPLKGSGRALEGFLAACR